MHKQPCENIALEATESSKYAPPPAGASMAALRCAWKRELHSVIAASRGSAGKARMGEIEAERCREEDGAINQTEARVEML